MLVWLPLVIALLTPSLATAPGAARPAIDPAAAIDSAAATDSADTPSSAAATPAGACQKTADQAVLARFEPRIDADMEDCAYACLTSDLACARRCARQKLPVGIPRARCFARVVDCTTSNCKLACMFSDAGCRACRAEKCDPAFVACAGIPAR